MSEFSEYSVLDLLMAVKNERNPASQRRESVTEIIRRFELFERASIASMDILERITGLRDETPNAYSMTQEALAAYRGEGNP